MHSTYILSYLCKDKRRPISRQIEIYKKEDIGFSDILFRILNRKCKQTYFTTKETEVISFAFALESLSFILKSNSPAFLATNSIVPEALFSRYL